TKTSPPVAIGAVAGTAVFGVKVHCRVVFWGTVALLNALRWLFARNVGQSAAVTSSSATLVESPAAFSSRSASLTLAAKSKLPAGSRDTTPTSVRLQSHIHGPQYRCP